MCDDCRGVRLSGHGHLTRSVALSAIAEPTSLSRPRSHPARWVMQVSTPIQRPPKQAHHDVAEFDYLLYDYEGVFLRE